MLCKWSERENKVDVKPLSQVIKVAAYGASGREARDNLERGKEPAGQMQPSLVPILEC